MKRIIRSRLFASTVLCLSYLVFSQAPVPVPLHDGETIMVQGNLTIKQAGLKRYFILQTKRAYTLMFDPEESIPTNVHLLPILLNGQETMLAKHVGQELIVHGVVELNATSPYYFNGLFINSDSVTLSNGITVPASEQDRPPAPTLPSRYLLTFTMRSRPWSREIKIEDAEAHSVLSSAGIPGCSVNGGGDVLNCSCYDGFKPVRASSETGATSSEVSEDSPFAQFGIDESGRKLVVVHVVCQRTASPHRAK